MRITTPLLAAGLVAGALAVPAASQDPPPRPAPLELLSKDRTERAVELDLGRRGPSPGDRTLARGPIFDAAAPARRVGSYTAEITTMEPRTLLADMEVTLVLAGGQISVDGSLPFRSVMTPAGAPLPVTGGTGAYAEARGTATLRGRAGAEPGFTFTVELR